MEIKVTGKQGGKREERMIEGKREKGSKNNGGGAEGESGRKEGRGKGMKKRRGEVIGVCLCTYMFLPLSNTVDVGSD